MSRANTVRLELRIHPRRYPHLHRFVREAGQGEATELIRRFLEAELAHMHQQAHPLAQVPAMPAAPQTTPAGAPREAQSADMPMAQSERDSAANDLRRAIAARLLAGAPRPGE